MIRKFTASLAAVSLLGACSTIVNEDQQKIAIRTQPPMDAQCQYGTDTLDQNVTAPGKITVRRSREDIEVQCVDEATGSTGKATVASGIAPWFWGNILIGGLIGVGIDFGTGSAWEYPEDTKVPMQDVIGTTPETVEKTVPVETVPDASEPEPAAVAPAEETKTEAVQSPFAKQEAPKAHEPVKVSAPAATPDATSGNMPKRSGVIAPVPVFVLPEHLSETR